MFAFAYDVFLGDFSLYSLKSHIPKGEIYTSAYNFVAGSFGGELGGEMRGIFGNLKFFSSGNMERTDEDGQVLGSFSSNFIKLSGGREFKVRNFYGILGLGLSYVSLDQKNVGLGASLFSRIFTIREFKGFNVEGYLLLDNVGYEMEPIGLSRGILPYKVSLGGKVFGDRSSVLLEIGRYYMGNYVKVGGELGVNILNLGFSFDSKLRNLNGGYGLDFLSGLSILGGVGYRNIKFEYSYTFMGLFGSRNIFQISYRLN